MNKKNLTLLLDIIKNKKNVLLLRREGLSFKQIVELTEVATKEKYIDYSGNQIALTDLGYTFLDKNIDSIKKRNKSEWIDSDIKNKVKPFPKNEVYLPDRSELSF